MPALTWREYFMGMAEYAATKSKDTSTQVGSVIADRNNRIVSLGFNGPASGTFDVKVLKDRAVKIRRTLHAELNAILFAKQDLSGCTIYVTHPPCSQCAAAIIQVGIQRVVCYAPTPEFLSRWQEDYDDAQAQFFEAGVEFILVERREK